MAVSTSSFQGQVQSTFRFKYLWLSTGANASVSCSGVYELYCSDQDQSVSCGRRRLRSIAKRASLRFNAPVTIAVKISSHDNSSFTAE